MALPKKITLLALAIALSACSDSKEQASKTEVPKPSGPVAILEKSAVGPWTVSTYEIVQMPDDSLVAMLKFDTANADDCAAFVKQVEPWLTFCKTAATQGFEVILQGAVEKSYQDTTVYDGMLTRAGTQEKYRAAFSEAQFDSFNMRISPMPGENLDQATNFFFDAKVGADRNEILKIEELREKASG